MKTKLLIILTILLFACNNERPPYVDNSKLPLWQMYDLQLGDYIRVDSFNHHGAPYFITRVPGGWVLDGDDGMVFIPYNNEFLKK